MLKRLVTAAALLSSGLLAGAFGYGAVNVMYAFRQVPLDVRFTFHTALMTVNGVVMQSAMALAALSTLVLAVLLRSRARVAAAVASGLVVVTFLVTRFGNVPINGQIKVWAAGSPPPDHAAALQRWETFHVVRTATAFLAFALVVVLVTLGDRLLRSEAPEAVR